ncbi:MAG: hypothetical protein FJ035_10160 [Chloroflexi bacterium]|nr:hypothetical protein [Chloroflexota bacterium]
MAARVAALHGLRCVGTWRNEAVSRSGAFAVRVEAGGGGGVLAFEVGGAVFGGAGGTFEAPFRVEGAALVVDAPSALLGRVRARIGLDGRAEGRLEGPSALGPRAVVALGDYALADGVLRLTLRVDAGDGSPVTTAVVDAACARR